MAAVKFDPMERIGGGGGDEYAAEGGDFAGMGGSFAGPQSAGGGEFIAQYLQNRIKGMNRATVSPAVNQRRVMASPEFALAKTLGISTPYNSGGSQVDISSARKVLDPSRPDAAMITRIQKEDAQAKLDAFNKRNAGVPMNPVLEGAGFRPVRESMSDSSGSAQVQSAFDKIQEKFGKPQNRIEPIPATPSPDGGQQKTQPTIPSSADQAATPISPEKAREATKAPIGAELPATSGETSQTVQKETTKGARLDTISNQNVYQQRANNYRTSRGLDPIDFSKQEPAYDQQKISDANDSRDMALRAIDRTSDAGEKMALRQTINEAQDARESVNKDYNQQVSQNENIKSRNQRLFANPYGPDGGASWAARDKAPALSPVGGYEERYWAGQRGGDPDAKRGTPGYMGKDTVPVGPMTNQPAKTPQEAEQRIARFNAEGEAQKIRNQEAASQKADEIRRKRVEEMNRKYAGPVGRRVA